MLQAVLRALEKEVRPHVHLDDRTVLNAPHARFIRQVLRDFEPNLKARIAVVERVADALLADQEDPSLVLVAAEAEEVDAFLNSAYELILGRPIDVNGLATYRTLLGMSGARVGALHVVRALLNSEEFHARHERLDAS